MYSYVHWRCLTETVIVVLWVTRRMRFAARFKQESITNDWKDAFRNTLARWKGWVAGPVSVRPSEPMVATPVEYGPLTKVILTDEVSRTLFGEYAGHRNTDRGAEETGWVLLGHREHDTATVLATLPAGAERDAGTEHVRFNTEAQALASRIVRQEDRRLTLLGVVHTHPGTLRHPSQGDLRGDREWVRRLRGKQGIFAIGTVDVHGAGTPDIAVGEHPLPHVQQLGELRFDWYTLSDGDNKYQPVQVELTIGPDLAIPLRAVWPVIEAQADRLDRLARQQSNVKFAIVRENDQSAVVVHVPLAEPGRAIRAIVEAKSVKFLYEADGELFQADLPAGTEPDRGVYLLLAELAARD